jgi:hypothetical protein
VRPQSPLPGPRAQTFSATFGRQFPAAVACRNDDLGSQFTYLRFPVEHHKRIRHSNFIERTFGETRRRVKVIGRLPDEDIASPIRNLRPSGITPDLGRHGCCTPCHHGLCQWCSVTPIRTLRFPLEGLRALCQRTDTGAS